MPRLSLIFSLLLLASVNGFAVTRWHPATTHQTAALHRPWALQSTLSTRAPSSSSSVSRASPTRETTRARPIKRIDLSEFIFAFVKAVFEDLADIVYTVTSALLWVRHPVTSILGTLPPSVRFFAQPFLILYLVPLLLIRDLLRPSQQEVSRILLQG